MSTEQERADFEAWFTKATGCASAPKDIFVQTARDIAWSAWQARAALQSQVPPNRQGGTMDKLFCDLKTDEEKAMFFFSGRGHETGVISQAIQNDVAMAYYRCVEYKKELGALQSQDREDTERLDWIEANHGCDISEFADGRWEVDVPYGPCGVGKDVREAIDHARHIEGKGG